MPFCYLCPKHLGFLQSGFDSGLSDSFLMVQLAAMPCYRGRVQGVPLDTQPGRAEISKGSDLPSPAKEGNSIGFSAWC